MSNRKRIAGLSNGRVIVLEREQVALISGLVRDGIRYRTTSLGRPESTVDARIRTWLDDVTRELLLEASWQPGSQVGDGSATSVVEEDEVIDVAEASRILGRPRRTVVSWAGSLGGWGGGKGRGWKFNRSEVVAYADALRDGAA